MHSTDIAHEAEQVRQLARDFEKLRAQVRDLTWQPGADALTQISPLLLQAQNLTAQALARLDALDSSPYTAVPGSRFRLETIAGAVASAAFAASGLATALLCNPYEGADYPGPPVDERTVRAVRHAQAIPIMTKHLTAAAHQLDTAATCCHYVATSITEDHAYAATTAPAATPTPAPAPSVSVIPGELRR
ncbi:hypothetical protein [Streptomyces sp. NPDC059076]|uniref:hypothetical protein n=1 Tax=unclassified Streptomyces TaxID=2593676 RepID=UPI0036A5DE14